MREIRPSGSEGGARSIPCPYPYRPPRTRAVGRFTFHYSTYHQFLKSAGAGISGDYKVFMTRAMASAVCAAS